MRISYIVYTIKINDFFFILTIVKCSKEQHFSDIGLVSVIPSVVNNMAVLTLKQYSKNFHSGDMNFFPISVSVTIFYYLFLNYGLPTLFQLVLKTRI
jgi:hypothetical protein